MFRLSDHEDYLTRSGVLDRGVPQASFDHVVEFTKDAAGVLHRTVFCRAQTHTENADLREARTVLLNVCDVWEDLCDQCWLAHPESADIPWSALIGNIQNAWYDERETAGIAQKGDLHERIWELTLRRRQYAHMQEIIAEGFMAEETRIWYQLIQDKMLSVIQETFQTWDEKTHFQAAWRGRTLRDVPDTSDAFFESYQHTTSTLVAIHEGDLYDLETTVRSYLLRHQESWEKNHLLVSGPQGLLAFLLEGIVPEGNWITPDPTVQEITLALWEPDSAGDLRELVHAQTAAQALA